MKQTVYIFLMAVTTLLTHCGKGVVDIDGDATYEPKLVIEGYLFPNTKVDNIRISRNFPLNKEINVLEFPVANAEVFLTDVEKDSVYPLEYNAGLISYQYNGQDLHIENGKKYRLQVEAILDGKDLAASAVTSVPEKGFVIDRDKSRLAPMKYREKDADGEVKTYTIAYKPSPGTDFYALSIVALNASQNTFVEENPFGLKKEDIDDQLLDQLKYEASWAQTSPERNDVAEIEILWFDVWFYGRYRAILYAGDVNFKYYFTTHDAVQDIDGNLYEPRFNITGDGIGVFGSAIADTVYFEVLR